MTTHMDDSTKSIPLEIMDNTNEAITNDTQTERPPSKSNICLFYSFYFGVCSLLPWNCLLVSDDFFKQKVKDSNELDKMYTSTFTSCANITVVATFMANLLFFYKFNRNKRTYAALIMMFSGFLVLTAFISVDTQKFAKAFFIIVILTSMFLCFSSTVVQASFFAMYAYFPPSYVGTFFTGQAFSGLVAVAIKLISMSVNLSGSNSTYIFFGLCLGIIILAIIFYTSQLKLAFYKETMSAAQRDTKDPDTPKKSLSFRTMMVTYYRILLKILPQAITIFSTFFVTLFLFPVLPVKWVSVNGSQTWSNYFIMICVFLMFNIGDTASRFFARYVQWPKGNTILLPIFAIARIIFFFPFVMCQLNDNAGYTVFPRLLKYDAFPAIIMFLFGFTNGYFPSIAFTSAYQNVNPDEGEHCNGILVLLLGVGLSLGSFMSFLL